MTHRLSCTQRAWLSVAGGFLIMTGAGLLGTLSLFYIPISTELGFSQASLAVYVTCMSMCGIVMQPLVGAALVRFQKHVRWIAVFGAVWGFMSYFWLSRCTRLFEFYIGGVLLSVIVPIVTALLGVDVVTHWFSKRRSMAISIVMMGTSAGTVLYSQVVQRVIGSMGWRAGYVAMGVLVVVMSVLGALLISPPPACYGMKPYGYTDTGEAKEQPLDGVTLKRALRMPGFWMFALAVLCGSGYIMGMQQSLVPMFQIDRAFTPERAAFVLSVYSVMCALAKPVMGIFYERFGIRKTILLIFALEATGIFLLIVTRSAAPGIAAAVLFGLGNVFGTVILAAFVADAFGRREYGAILGWANIFFTLGVGTGPVIAGKSFDIFGSYRAAYCVYLAFCLASTLLTLLADKSIQKSKPCSEA